MAAILRRLTLSLVLALLIPSMVLAAVERRKFATATAYLIVEVLDNDLVHFEVSSVGSGPSTAQPLYTSPMVSKTIYDGPSSFIDHGNTLETPDLRLIITPSNLCVEVQDKTKGGASLTTFCPAALDQDFKGINIDPGNIDQLYGLGQQFKKLGDANGDWTMLGVREGLSQLGNGFQGFQGAAVGNVQIPVYYAVGKDGLNYALFLDNVYHQRWDFTTFWWEVRMFGDQLRWYVMAGPDLPDLRRDYLELTGTPPVPPRKAFGLWISEFGYDNFGEIDNLLAGLRGANFPIDGFVLDLNWFGGIVLGNDSKSHMGRLDWDQNQTPALADNAYAFPNPDSKIQGYHNDHTGLVVIEESYLANSTDTFSQMPTPLSSYRRTNGVCDASNQNQAADTISGFWGKGRMIDWSDPAAGIWIHDNRRFPNLTQKGVTAHWTDLGEPETYDGSACYEGVETTVSGRKNAHSDVHNLYNLLWNQSIWDGYVAHQGQANFLGMINPRPFIVTRSGAGGTQRTGAAMWSGDIASNLESLATHANAQMHMSFSGIDYYGADIGGFRREVLPYNDKEGRYRGYEAEMYTQWLANGAWFDVPVRPHTDNEFVQVSPPYVTTPHLVGHVPSNLANLRQRYELIPYYYSLAHLAHQTGAPLVPPPVFYYQDDPKVRGMGHEKMIGRDLLVSIVARHGEYERDVYLPAGRWVNYHTNEWVESGGETMSNVPVYRDGLLRLPTFARAGALLPLMPVDAHTKDAFGHRKSGAAPRTELIVRVYADSTPTSFILFEDDGTTLKYDAGGRPFYHHRTTRLSQQQTSPTSVTVTIAPAIDVNGNGAYPGAVTSRQNAVELVVDDAAAMAVSLNGNPLPQLESRNAFDAAEKGWINATRNVVLAKSPVLDVYTTTKTFAFMLQPVVSATSVHFVCDNGVTIAGQSVYVVGSIPTLGNWNPMQALRLNPSIYWEYIWNPPADHTEPGPSEPVWTGVIADFPANPNFEWKCIRRNEDGSGTVDWEPGANNVLQAQIASGYAGRAYGQF